ncbi:hypothetical protein E2L06_09220 [Haloterrigena sp. H1]|uniref:hypothetical protein n=1 Tax=Haloterrigena sp. H1 TaxID=2552943 RepID=UPI00110DAAC9|nr:hypothetical protein [Haloterrigena sp. H1]TMT86768.1 hypothetical protein E2L06_09220 [Haloterrigena sp. H1]
MSVLRQPEVLGRTARRRVVGVTAALSAAAVETVAVGCWFSLVVGSRTTSTALAGLGVLFSGSLLRMGIFRATVSDLGELLQPKELGVTVALTSTWVVWLFLAELIGDPLGVAVAAVVFAGMLTGQFVLERHSFSQSAVDGRLITLAVSGLLLAAGASTLLATVWFTDWAISSSPLVLGSTTIVFRIGAVHLGMFVFGLFAFLAHQHRFQRLLEP